MKAPFDMRLRRHLWSMGILTALSCPVAAFAAPFCVSTESLPPQCLYHDPAICQRDAAEQGGVCSVNTAEYKPTPGIGQYCVVTPSLVSLCVYPDRTSCMADAESRDGTCVKAPTVAPYGAPDPYAAIDGR